jgi:hypothetical protein
MAKFDGGKEEWSSSQHALAYLNAADNLSHRMEGEAILLPVSSRISQNPDCNNRESVSKYLKKQRLLWCNLTIKGRL